MQEKFFGKNRIASGKKKAFTLIEIMIVLAVTMLLAGSGFVGYQSSKRDASMHGAKREVAKVIRLAQSYALQGKTQENIAGAPAGHRTPCGYGFEFTSPTEYRIFYTYKTAGGTCASNNTYPNSMIMAKNGSVNQQFSLPTNVDLSGYVSGMNNTTRIYFAIPFGDVYQHNNKNSFSGATITLRYGGDSAMTEAITINEKGDVAEQ